MTALFVTATGTGIGKTFVTCLLARQLRASGRTVRALKPIMSGYDPAGAADSDAGKILAALGVPPTPDAVAAGSPWRFAAPLSPDMAAAREGRALDVDAVAAFCRSAAIPGGVLLVEGVGGVMVPLSGRQTIRDLIALLRWPALLVAGSYLGTLSHTLTAVESLAGRGIPLSGIIVDETPGSTVPLVDTVEALIRQVAPVPVIGLARPPSDRGCSDLARFLGLLAP